jgi:glyoxylase-like metal-dependent hydrolase (beta-lactamase superfamily II)
MEDLEDEWFDIVAKARTGRGLSLAGIAEAVGVSFEALESWESGAGMPTSVQLASLASALGLDFDRLAAIQQGKGRPVAPRLRADDSLRVETLTGSMHGYAVHAYLLYREGDPDAALIDTGYEAIRAIEAVLHRRLLLRWVALTHCHHDHMEGAALIKAQTGAMVAVPAAEFAAYRAHQREAPDLAVEDGTEIAVSPTITLTAISTPGHTTGGTCYRIGNVCAVGDALFASSMGRAMSSAGYRSLLSSLRARIFSLPEDTILLPGHGPRTTVRDERRNNPFFPAQEPDRPGGR